ncbi:MAG: hypothetical protein PHU25_13580 [Deltaproteobacteria bacterium]|nr:hypothetical protein [Deltaproteobacteria bacterium]
MTKFWFALLVLGLALNIGIAGCNIDAGDDDNDTGTTDGDTDGDTDSDGDTDGDTDSDTDSDSDTNSDCALNSGYPCSCEVAVGTCDDGSQCVYFAQGATIGLCSATCTGSTDTTSCVNTAFGIQSLGGGACVFGASQTEITNCGIICEYNGENGACPSDQVCTAGTGGSICMPPSA